MIVNAMCPGNQALGQSGDVAASAANSVIAAVSGRTSYITGFSVTGTGATAGSTISVTVTGLLGGTLTYDLVIPAGATAAITPLFVNFPTPLAASAANSAVTVNVPSFGTGNLHAASNAYGFQL